MSDFPLHDAAKNGDIRTVQILLDLGMDVNTRDDRGRTALHCATAFNHVLIVELLLTRGANTAAQAAWVPPPLCLAAQKGYMDIAGFLLLEGADVNIRDLSMGNTPLYHAAYFGQAVMICFLLDHGAEIRVTNARGYTPLHAAAMKGHKWAVDELLARGADPNACAFSDGLTPLMLAAGLGCKDVAELLLANGANIHLRDNAGKTALRWAVDTRGSEAVVELLAQAVEASQMPTAMANTFPWAFSVITADKLLYRFQCYNAGGAAATWQGTGEPPEEIQVEVVLSCPVCRQAWPARLKKVWVWLTNNSQWVGQECCPSCGQCTLAINTRIPKQSPTVIYFIATIHAAVPGLPLAFPQIRLIRVE